MVSRARLIAFGLTSFLSIWIGFFAFEIDTAVSLIRLLGYWFLLFSFGGFGWFAYKVIRKNWNQLARAYKNPAFPITLVLLSWLLFVSQPLGYRMVLDEVLLNGTSLQLHENRQPLFPHAAFFDANDIQITQASLDKRPLFFPFLVSIVHDFSGYRPENAFYLNIVLSILILSLAWGIGFALSGIPGGIFSSLLLATIPLIPQLGTGGGFEIANGLFIILFFLAGWATMRRPDKETLSLLIFTTVLLAQLRYESALFVFFSALFILIAWCKTKRLIVPAAMIVAPVLLILLPLHQQVFEHNESLWQLKDIPGATSVFSFRYFQDNLGHALNYFLSGEKSVPTSTLLFFTGVAGLIYFALNIRRWAWDGEPIEQAACVLWFSLALQTIMIFCYFWGQLDDPIIHRLSVPIWIWFWISSLFMLRKWLCRRIASRILLFAVGLYFVRFSLPLYSDHKYNSYPPPSVFNHLRSWSEDISKKRNLFLSKDSVFWITEGYASYTPKGEDTELPFLENLIDRKIYENIFAFEWTQFDHEEKRMIPLHPVKTLSQVKSEIVYEFAIDQSNGGRITRILEVDSSEMDIDPSTLRNNVAFPDLVALKSSEVESDSSPENRNESIDSRSTD